MGEKPLVNEPFAGQSTHDEGWNEGGGSGQALYVDASLYAGTHQQESGITDGGGARITAQAGRSTCDEVCHYAVHHLVLVVGVKGPQARFKAVQSQK